MRMMKYVCSLLPVALMAAACGGGDPEGAALPDLPELPVDTLEAVLELGVELGDSTEIFGAIADALIDAEGRILVLDQVSASLRLYDSEGNHVMRVARRGDGPGELGMPWDMFMTPEGDLMVCDPLKRGFVVFDDSLRFLEEHALWVQNPPFQGTPLSGNRFAAYKIDVDMVSDRLVMRRVIALYEYGGEDWDLVLWKDSITAGQSELLANPSMLIRDLLDPLSLGGNGSDRVYFALKDGEEYAVTGWDPEGNEVLSISMNLRPVRKSEEELEAEAEYVSSYLGRMGAGGGGMQFRFEPDPYRDMVTGVDTGPDGNLWVRRGTLNEPFFDVFDPATGELMHHAVFPAEGWSWQTVVSREGILAWEEDPEAGYQKLYVLR